MSVFKIWNASEKPCVRCGKESEYDATYIDGSGLLFEECWYKLWPMEASQPMEEEIKEGDD